jgi:hypothetical protein
VNQLLDKMDGSTQINNILVIGMTNRFVDLFTKWKNELLILTFALEKILLTKHFCVRVVLNIT